MTRRTRIDWLVSLYPSRWRTRYGEELRTLLEEEPLTLAVIVDVARHGLAARRMELVSEGGLLTMNRTRTNGLAASLAVLLLLPALVFWAAALLRNLLPPGHQPAAAAQTVFDFLANGGLPHASVLALLTVAPLGAAVIGLGVTWRVLARDADARADLALLGSGLRRVARRPALVGAAFALLVSTGMLLLWLDHFIAG